MKKYIFIIMALISNIVFGYNQTFKVGEYIKYDVLAQVPEFNISGRVGTLETEYQHTIYMPEFILPVQPIGFTR